MQDVLEVGRHLKNKSKVHLLTKSVYYSAATWHAEPQYINLGSRLTSYGADKAEICTERRGEIHISLSPFLSVLSVTY